MVDIVDPETRSRMMSGIRGKNTRIEVQLRKALFSRGYRYRLNAKDLPGKPDLVLPKHKAVVFINGCFWHGHACHLFRMPSSNGSFWQGKITGNRLRDQKNVQMLMESGWRVAIVWECALRGKTRLEEGIPARLLSDWLKSGDVSHFIEIAGTIAA